MECDQRGCTPDYDDTELSGSFDLDWIPSFAGIIIVFILAVYFGTLSLTSYREGKIPQSIGQALISAGCLYFEYRLINWGMVGGLGIIGGLLVVLWLAVESAKYILTSLPNFIKQTVGAVLSPVIAVFFIVAALALFVVLNPIVGIPLAILYSLLP